MPWPQTWHDGGKRRGGTVAAPNHMATDWPGYLYWEEGPTGSCYPPPIISISTEPPGADDVEEAPQDGKLYARQNGAWVEVPANLNSTGEWTFNNNTSAPPQNGNFRLDNFAQDQATTIWLDRETDTGIDASFALRMIAPDGVLPANTVLILQDKDDSGKHVSFNVTSFTDTIDTQGYATFGLSPRSFGQPLVSNQRVMVGFRTIEPVVLAFREEVFNAGETQEAPAAPEQVGAQGGPDHPGDNPAAEEQPE